MSLHHSFFLLFIYLFVTVGSFALETTDDSLEDITVESLDDLFGDISQEESLDEEFDTNSNSVEEGENAQIDSEDDGEVSLLKELTTQTGGSFTFSYAFAAGYAPGWSEAPWYWDDQNETFTDVIGADLNSTFILDFQVSPQLRVYQTFSCDFPDYSVILDSFWAEYNLLNQVFFKLGQYEESWGISSNYGYTNLLARLPEGNSGGDAYTFRMNLPIGVGGLQLLTTTRSGYVDDKNIENLQAGDLGYGMKYNYAHPLADINLGVYYHELLPLRAIGTLKTTLFDSMELYIEGLVAFPYEDYNSGTVGSGNIGLADDYFDDRLTVNAEYFYNGEVYTNVVESDSGWTEDEVSPFVKGHNMAFNLYYSLGFANMNIFSRLLYNFSENTGKWAPGFQFTPFDDMSVILTCPIAIGDRDGTYYSSNYDEKNRPFSITLALILSGSYKFAKYD